MQLARFARSQCREQNLRMPKVSRAICWQVGALVIAIVVAIVLSRFVPIVSFIEASQQHVMSWGAWGAVCYPLLFAACNILLLPGCILAVGGGLLFLYVYAGTLGQFAVRIMRGKSYPRMIEYWIWGGAFVTTALLLIVLGRMAYAAIQTSHNSKRPTEDANASHQIQVNNSSPIS